MILKKIILTIKHLMIKDWTQATNPISILFQRLFRSDPV